MDLLHEYLVVLQGIKNNQSSEIGQNRQYGSSNLLKINILIVQQSRLTPELFDREIQKIYPEKRNIDC